MKKKSKQALLYTSLIAIGLIFVLVSTSLYAYMNPNATATQNKIVDYIFTKKVEKYRGVVTKYAEKNDVDEHVDLILAMMMQESGGKGDDPMQASESLCGEVGCIDSPDESIKQGVDYFSRALDASDGDVELAVQAYNFGIGFIDYVQAHDEDYTQEVVIDFSQEMYDKAEQKDNYSCLRKEAEEWDACYGDIYYARDVFDHKKNFAQAK